MRRRTVSRPRGKRLGRRRRPGQRLAATQVARRARRRPVGATDGAGLTAGDQPAAGLRCRSRSGPSRSSRAGLAGEAAAMPHVTAPASRHRSSAPHTVSPTAVAGRTTCRAPAPPVTSPRERRSTMASSSRWDAREVSKKSCAATGSSTTLRGLRAGVERADRYGERASLAPGHTSRTPTHYGSSVARALRAAACESPRRARAWTRSIRFREAVPTRVGRSLLVLETRGGKPGEADGDAAGGPSVRLGALLADRGGVARIERCTATRTTSALSRDSRPGRRAARQLPHAAPHLAAVGSHL
jgi:hypothetical protein